MGAQGLVAAVRQRGGKLVKSITRNTGYNVDQLSAGVQLATGLFLMLALMGWPQAWTALTLPDAAITPVYAVVTFIVVLQANQGTASQFVLMRAAGAVAGGVAGLVCMYLTQAANGGSYENTATKGAVMVTLLSVCTFCFSLLRFRFPRWWFAFTVATFSMPMVALNPYYLDFVEYKALFYWWLQIALGIGAAALCSTFVFPITAGAKVQAKTAEALKGLADLTSAAVKCMVSLQLGPDGLPAGLTGVLDGRNAADTGLQEAFKPLYDAAVAVSACITQARALLLVVDAEWSVYSSAHTFPREAYEILLYISRAYLSSLLALLYPMQSGRLALRAVQRMAPEFQKAADLLATCLRHAADCVGNGGSFEDALCHLRTLEERWHALGALCPVINSSWGENEVLTSDMLVGTLFSLGTRVRRLYFTLPEALKSSQPGARAACFRHFRRSGDKWDLAQPQEALRQRTLARTATLDVDTALLTPRGASPRQTSANGTKPAQQQQPQGWSPPATPFRAWLTPRSCGQDAGAPWKRAPVDGGPLPWEGAQKGAAASAAAPAGAAAAERIAAQTGSAAAPAPAAATERRERQAGPAPAFGPANGWQGSSEGGSAADPGALLQEPPVWFTVPNGHNGYGYSPSEEALWEPPDAATLAERFPPTICVPAALPTGVLGRAAHAVHSATGLTAEHAALAFQLALAMGAACTLHVTRTTYEALYEKTIWVVVTVAVVLESAVGGLVLKSGLRIIGTVGAGLIGVGLMGAAYLFNGLSYANEPAKFITMTALLPAVGFLLMINHVRFAVPYGYALSCCKFTMPIIALSGYVMQVAIWRTALYRALNILLGIGLDLAAATLVLPVTSQKATKHRVQEVLAGLADLAEATLVQFVEDQAGPGEKQGGSAACTTGTPRCSPGSAPGSPRHAAAGSGGPSSPPSRPAYSLPRTPLSTAEAAEIALSAAGERAAARRDRAAEVARCRSLSTTPTASLPVSRTVSLDGAASTSLPVGSVKAEAVAARLAKAAAAADHGGVSRLRRLFRKLLLRSGSSGQGAGAGGGLALGMLHRQSGVPGTHAVPAAPAAGATADVESRFDPAAYVPAQPSVSAVDDSGASTAASLPDARAAAVAASPGSSSAPFQPSPGGRLPSGSPSPPPFVLEIPHSAFEVAAGPAADNGDSASGGGSAGGSRHGTPGASMPAESGRSASLQGSPPRSAPLQLPPSPGRQQRRTVSLSPDLPTIVSQQALHLEELPSLPPLHIPSRHQLAIVEETDTAAANPVAAASAAHGGSKAAPAGGSGGAASALARQLSRVSASSSVFWLGTPREAGQRRERSHWLQERALGRSFMAVRHQGAELAATIAHMHELALFARFEWVPFQRPHRMQPKDILAAQHACRKLLNVLLTFAYLDDSPDVPHRGLLTPVPREVRAVAAQMGEALRALSLVLDGRLAVDRALAMVFNLQLQVQLLLLEVEAAARAAMDLEAAEGRADAVLGVAALGVMFSATQTVQLLYRCVLRVLGAVGDHAAAERAFAQSAAWGASVEAILVARGVVLASFATEADEGRSMHGGSLAAEAQAALARGALGRGD